MDIIFSGITGDVEGLEYVEKIWHIREFRICHVHNIECLFGLVG